MKDKVKQHPLFANMEEEDIERILNSSKNWFKAYAKGDIIHLRGERCESLSIIISGEVKAEMQNPNGKTLLIEKMHYPAVLAPNFIFSAKNLFPVDVIAVTQTELWSIDRNSLFDHFLSYPILLRNFFVLIGNKSELLVNKLWLSALSTLREKVAGYLLKLYMDTNKREFTFTLTREELANLFGVERPSLSRILSELNKSGIIKVEGKKVQLLDIERLYSITR